MTSESKARWVLKVLVASILLVVLLDVVLVVRARARWLRRSDPAAAYAVGDHIDFIADPDVAEYARTLLVLVRSSCSACRADRAFHLRLLRSSGVGTCGQVLLVAGPGDETTHVDLAVPRAKVRRYSGGRIMTVPTLMLVDRTGVVRQIWQGVLGAQEQGALARRLCPSPPAP